MEIWTSNANVKMPKMIYGTAYLSKYYNNECSQIETAGSFQ